MAKTLKIEIASAIVLVGFFAAVVFHYIISFYANQNFQLNTFLVYPAHQEFEDFFSNHHLVKDLAPYFPYHPAYYFPAAYLVFYPFACLGAYFGCAVYSLIFILSLIALCKHYLSRESNKLLNFKNIFIFTFLTYPFLFAFERGNLESLLFVLLAFSLYCYSHKKYLISAILLSFPISMKVYPAVFLILFVSDKHYKETVVSIFVAMMLTLFALVLFKGSLFQQLTNLNMALHVFKQNYMEANSCMMFNLGYYGFIQTLLRVFHAVSWGALPNASSLFVKLYAASTLLISCFLSCYIIFFENIFWKKIALLVCMILLFPYISYDYKLLDIYLPFFFFVNEKPDQIKYDLRYLIIFSLLFIPKNYYLIGGYVSISSFINVILLTSLIFFIIKDKFVQCLWKRDIK